MSNVRKLNEYSDDVSNAELVKKSQLGDKGAFEELVKRVVINLATFPLVLKMTLFFQNRILQHLLHIL